MCFCLSPEKVLCRFGFVSSMIFCVLSFVVLLSTPEDVFTGAEKDNEEEEEGKEDESTVINWISGGGGGR